MWQVSLDANSSPAKVTSVSITLKNITHTSWSPLKMFSITLFEYYSRPVMQHFWTVVKLMSGIIVICVVVFVFWLFQLQLQLLHFFICICLFIGLLINPLDFLFSKFTVVAKIKYNESHQLHFKTKTITSYTVLSVVLYYFLGIHINSCKGLNPNSIVKNKATPTWLAGCTLRWLKNLKSTKS